MASNSFPSSLGAIPAMCHAGDVTLGANGSRKGDGSKMCVGEWQMMRTDMRRLEGVSRGDAPIVDVERCRAKCRKAWRRWESCIPTDAVLRLKGYRTRSHPSYEQDPLPDFYDSRAIGAAVVPPSVHRNGFRRLRRLCLLCIMSAAAAAWPPATAPAIAAPAVGLYAAPSGERGVV